MLQHKQEERELKRYEGDIIKKQHQLRRTMDGLQNSKFWNLDSYTSLQFSNSQAWSSTWYAWPGLTAIIFGLVRWWTADFEQVPDTILYDWCSYN